MPRAEPTNNIPPRLTGRRIEGSLVLDVARGGTAVILCEVPGFPVPRYRSVSPLGPAPRPAPSPPPPRPTFRPD